LPWSDGGGFGVSVPAARTSEGENANATHAAMATVASLTAIPLMKLSCWLRSPRNSSGGAPAGKARVGVPVSQFVDVASVVGILNRRCVALRNYQAKTTPAMQVS